MSNTSHPGGQAAACQEPAKPATGLVPYTTSPTAFQGAGLGTNDPNSKTIFLNHSACRLARLKHHLRTASRLVKETMARAGHDWRAVFVTLTYRPGVEWQARHLSVYLDALQKWATRKVGHTLPYVWCAELQKRGAVHYHVVVWLPKGCGIPRPDGRGGWWRHGCSNVKSVKRNAVGYLMKYVSKGCDVGGGRGEFPRGARICGSGGLDKLARCEFTWWRWPRFLREVSGFQTGADFAVVAARCRRGAMGVQRARGGGWVWRASGEITRAAWGLVRLMVPARDKMTGRRGGSTVIVLSDDVRIGTHDVRRPGLGGQWLAEQKFRQAAGRLFAGCGAVRAVECWDNGGDDWGYAERRSPWDDDIF